MLKLASSDVSPSDLFKPSHILPLSFSVMSLYALLVPDGVSSGCSDFIPHTEVVALIGESRECECCQLCD